MNKAAISFNTEKNELSKRILFVNYSNIITTSFVDNYRDHKFDWEIENVDNILMAYSSLGIRHYDFVVINPLLKHSRNGNYLSSFLDNNCILYVFYADKDYPSQKPTDTVIIERGCTDLLVSHIADRLCKLSNGKTENLYSVVRSFKFYRNLA